MKIIAVRDMKAEIYLKPTFQSSLADAIRSWEMISNEGDSLVSKFPNDFRLHHIGDFDANTGDITLLQHIADLGSAADFKRKPDAQTAMPM